MADGEESRVWRGADRYDGEEALDALRECARELIREAQGLLGAGRGAVGVNRGQDAPRHGVGLRGVGAEGVRIQLEQVRYGALKGRALCRELRLELRGVRARCAAHVLAVQ